MCAPERKTRDEFRRSRVYCEKNVEQLIGPDVVYQREKSAVRRVRLSEIPSLLKYRDRGRARVERDVRSLEYDATYGDDFRRSGPRVNEPARFPVRRLNRLLAIGTRHFPSARRGRFNGRNFN